MTNYLDAETQREQRQAETSRGRWRGVATILGLIALLAVAAWLRLDHARTANTHVDEFTTLWAAQQVRELGAPIMPSGVLYTRGLLYTYLVAGAEMLFGAGRATAQVVSIVTGLLTILALWWVGKRGWRASVGWLSAIGLALLPEAIIWSARARFYAQLQLLVLLALWAMWESLRADPDNRRAQWRWQLTFALSFVLALFSQEQALLLWPTILLATLIWRGWRWLLLPPSLMAQSVVLVAIVARFIIEIAGQPGYFETIQATRPYLGFVFDAAGAWTTYAPLLVGNGHFVWTIFALIAVVNALIIFARAGKLNRVLPSYQSTLYYALNLAGVVAVLFLLVGTSWRDTRYLFMVQTLWLLLGAAGIVGLLQGVAFLLNRPQWLAPMAGVAAVALALYALTGWSALARQEEDFAGAFDSVKTQRIADSAVISPQPPACAYVLGEPCAGYAIQRGYEEYVIPNDAGALVDRWTGAPLVNTPEQLEEVLRAHPQTWLVSDGFRLATRYDADYLRLLLEQFTLAGESQGALILRADGWRDLPQMIDTQPVSPALRFGPLALVGVSHTAPLPGTDLTIQLDWVGAEPIGAQINTSVRLVDSSGNTVASQDGPPAAGIIPTTLFFDTALPDRKTLTLPADLPAGDYSVEVVAYTLEPTPSALTAPQMVATITIP